MHDAVHAETGNANVCSPGIAYPPTRLKLYRFPERQREKERERESIEILYISRRFPIASRLLSICLIFHRDFRHVDLYDNWLADQNINVASEWQCPRSEFRFAEKNNLSPIVSAGCILNSAEANDEDLIERSKELHGVLRRDVYHGRTVKRRTLPTQHILLFLFDCALING